MNKSILTLFLGLLLSFSMFGNDKRSEINLFGRVTSKASGEEISFISIAVKNTTLGTSTDASGSYTLTNLPVGELTITAQGLGYKTFTKTVSLIEGESVELNIEVEEDVLNLDEVVVTGGRTQQKRAESLVIVNTLSPKMLEQTQSVVLGEGLNFATGLRYENDCQNCGFSQVRMNGLEGPYSQILINSRPIFSGLAGVYGLELIPANMLERIEVVRGGGSVLYGSNAVAGTINLILKDPKTNSFEAGYNLALIGAGVSDSNGPTADHNATFNASLVTADHNTGMAIFGNMRDRKMFDANGDKFSEIAPMKNTVIGARIFHRPSYRNKISVDFFNIREQRDGGNMQDLPHHERDVAEAVKHNMINGAVTFDQYLRDSDLLTVFASGQYLDRDSYYGSNQSLSDYGNSKDKTYNVGAQYKAVFNEKNNLIAGAEYTHSNLKDIKLGYPEYSIDETGKEIVVEHVPNRVISDQSLSTMGAFAQYEVRFGLFKLLLGARIEHYSVDDKQSKEADKSGTVFIPRASFMYDVTPYLQTRIGVSRGYRAPQIFDEDLHVDTSGSRQVIIKNDPNLKQENSTSVTLSFDFNKRLGNVNTNFLLEGFVNKLHNPFRKNSFEKSEDGKTVIYTRQNADKGAVVAGVNVEFKIAPVENFSVNGGFTWQSSRFKTPDEDYGEKKFLRTPDTYGYLLADWEFAKNFGVSLTGTYTGQMLLPYHGPEIEDMDAGEIRKSKTFIDTGLKLHYDMKLTKTVGVEWFAGVKNIFNSFQKDFDKGIDRDPSYIYGPSLPRTFFVGFKIGNLL